MFILEIIYKKILGEYAVTKSTFINESATNGINHDGLRPKDGRQSTSSLKASASDSINMSLLRDSIETSNYSSNDKNDKKNNNNTAAAAVRKNSLMNREILSDWPLLSRSAFTECLMCYAVDMELGPTVSTDVTFLYLIISL